MLIIAEPANKDMGKIEISIIKKFRGFLFHKIFCFFISLNLCNFY